MHLRDIFGDRKLSKKTTVYLLLIIITALFIYFYSSSLNSTWVSFPQRLINPAYIQSWVSDHTLTKAQPPAGRAGKIWGVSQQHNIHLRKRSTHLDTATPGSFSSKEKPNEDDDEDTTTTTEEDSTEMETTTVEDSTETETTTVEDSTETETTTEEDSTETETTTEEDSPETETTTGEDSTETETATEEDSTETQTATEEDSTETETTTEEDSTETETTFEEDTTAEDSIDADSGKEDRAVIGNDLQEDSAKGFLVYSSQCKIPDINPMHPSIEKLVEITPPLNCSETYAPLTRTEGNKLILDEKIAMSRDIENFTCCYIPFFRADDGKSDNSIGFAQECFNFLNNASIDYEFIVVRCYYDNGTTFYKNYHSFIHDKPHVEEKASNDSSPFNVLIVGVDSMSRLNMHRQLNKTISYLLNEMNALEMFGFNKVGDNTFPNLIPLMTGYDERELSEICWEGNAYPLDDCEYLWNIYSEHGYRTFYAEDTPYISSFNYVKKGFLKQPTDYYLRPFILAYEDDMGRVKPLNCHLCVGSISETEAVLQYTERFATHFNRKPYFAFSWINSLTHDFLNMGSSGDHMYEKFFKTLHQSGSLNRTIIILMGDHGMRWGAIRNTYVGRLEERLPMLLIALPPEFVQEHPSEAAALKFNSHRLVTPFDLHSTLKHLLHLNESWKLENFHNVSSELESNYTERSFSLFRPVPRNRSCDDAFIDEHWCTCELSLPVSTDDDEVQLIANFIVRHLNALVSAAKGLCANLTLQSITDARLWQPEVEHHKHTAEDHVYTVVVETKPGDGVFEGTARYSPNVNKMDLLGSVSRLNLYGNQSACINDAILKKYCFCS